MGEIREYKINGTIIIGIAMNGNQHVFLIVDANRCGANMEYEVFCIFAGLNGLEWRFARFWKF